MSWTWFQDDLGRGTTNFTLVAGRGAYTLTGNATGATLLAENGAFVLNGFGQPLFGHKLIAGHGSYSLSGGAIGAFQRGFRMEARRGEYKLSAPHVLLIKTSVPIKDPAPFVEQAWEQPENEGNLNADVIVEAG